MQTEEALMKLALAFETAKALADYHETGNEDDCPNDWAVMGMLANLESVLRDLEASLSKKEAGNS